MGMFDRGKFDPTANDGPMLKSTCIAVVVLSGISVILRFVSRRLVKQPLLWDDWMILIALPFAWSCCFITIAGIDHAQAGQHAIAILPTSIVKFFKLLYALQIVYPLPIMFIKFSMCFFYRRVFSVPQTKKPLMAIGAIVTLWGLAVILVAIFDCDPIKGFWHRLPTDPPAKCVDSFKYFLGVAVPNIATDIVLLLFPLPFVWNLKVTNSQKVALAGIFVLGGFITLVSILRMVALVQSSGEKDFTWALIPVNFWSELETNLGIVLANLPSMLPLLRLLMGKRASSTVGSGNQWSTKNSRNRWVPGSKNADFDRLTDSAGAPSSATQVSYGGKGYATNEWEMR